MDGNNELSYPQMARQREENIQAGEVAKAEDVNIELNHVVETFNRLIMMLSGEWGDGTGRIYELVDNAVSIANQALAKANDAVQKSGDTMTGHLNISLVPSSDYNVVNKKYVDDKITTSLADPLNRITELESFRDNLNATQVKLSNENFAGKNVNDGMNELFISVSSGKATVAAAITGKGVETASDASFKTMADNINAILTFQEGTAGGTATAEDIIKGKTAYARGALIVGTYVPTGGGGGGDTSDATATAEDIRLGKTAYARGEKLFGTMIATEYPDGPTIGTDTSDGTAYAGDILAGKIAYARGQRIVGTLQNVDVEEIYGADISSGKATSFNSMQIDPITEEKYIVDNITYAKDLSYVVRVTHKDGDTSKYYVESYAINNDGYYIQQTGNSESGISTKKYRYELSELGLEENESILAIKLGARGLYGDNKLCRLIVITRVNLESHNEIYVRSYTYHLFDNGVIGQMYSGEYIEDSKTLLIPSIGNPFTDNFLLATANLDKDRFIIGRNSRSGTNNVRLYSCKISGTTLIKTSFRNKSSYPFSTTAEPMYNSFSQDDRFLTYTGSAKDSSSYTNPYNLRVYPEDDYRIEWLRACDTAQQSYININGTDKFMVGWRTTSSSISSPLNQLHIANGDTGLGYVNGYSKSINTPGESNTFVGNALANDDIVLAFRSDGFLYVYDINILEVEEGASVEASNKIYVGGYDIQYYSSDLSTIIIKTTEGDLKKVSFEKDSENIVALKYKEQYFYNNKTNILSANVEDVRKGKTFIGALGTPETGTLEV